MATVAFTINGKAVSVEAEPGTPLLWVLREHLKLTGTKFGCGGGFCGACTVHLDGAAIRSCQTPVEKASGRKITTIEGLSPTSEHPLQKAWIAEQVPQCGYCQSGQIMQAASLLSKNKNPTREQIVGTWTAISAAAAPTSASCARSSAPRRRPEPWTGRSIAESLHTSITRREFLAGTAGLTFSFALGGACSAGPLRGSPQGNP